MDDAVQKALDLTPAADAAERTIDITTIGAKSGEPRRIEIWFHKVDGHWFITGSPGRARSWYANLVANPHFSFHLKHGVEADLPAKARPVTDADERRSVFTGMIAALPSSGNGEWPPLEAWLEKSPLVEVEFAA
ncbi:nitroreductase family deazaflavin-dependent oxidoreductase [Gryllotalpicola reticulitermitis]|uniref:Nitroreductase family deazaflavin-dependent oxidoreductase n=1 Tax=Gryllotalpicola reticulitermitis TaxID=1184153 RepID=A0ABV8Q4J3_9MICO